MVFFASAKRAFTGARDVDFSNEINSELADGAGFGSIFRKWCVAKNAPLQKRRKAASAGRPALRRR
jgi:hypothetical protein